MSLAIKALFEPLRSLAFGSIGAAYVGVGTVLEHPARILYIQNLTDVVLMFSIDGVNDHFPLPQSSFLLLDLSSNKTIESGYFMAKGDRLWVKDIGGIAPASGTVYFSVLYGIDY